ncbi:MULTISPECIES: hypothetical protein [Streptomyces]|uniref:hypothetical protein n=1 Tax=Streptomyces TaxID=1883 RepID=UPI0022522DE1|nr:MULTISPECIES: hypothetical protein [Streptomyces]MCX4430980.1 hypothetical protein [Streptomyces mirabilis]
MSSTMAVRARARSARWPICGAMCTVNPSVTLPPLPSSSRPVKYDDPGRAHAQRPRDAARRMLPPYC